MKNGLSILWTVILSGLGKVEETVMPKVIDTRKQKAKELLDMLERGPAFSDTFCESFTVDEAKRQYQLWTNSWIIPVAKRLIPELKEKGKTA
jgi:hypothetical protein